MLNNQNENLTLSKQDYFTIEKTYLNEKEIPYPILSFSTEETSFPEPSLSPEPSPALSPEPILSTGPAPTLPLKPKPTAVPTFSPEQTVTLSPEPITTLSPEQTASMASDELERAALANRILNNPRITLATFHPSGVADSAFAYDNIHDTGLGYPARRSHYGTAPGGSVYLSSQMLNVILLLTEKYSFTITEIAGANHSSGSMHYSGIAFDIGTINGKYATNGATARAFVADAKKYGATYTLIEKTCVHIDFR